MFARLLAGSAVALGAYSCPGSPSFIHASAKVTALAATPCEDVQQEISRTDRRPIRSLARPAQ